MAIEVILNGSTYSAFFSADLFNKDIAVQIGVYTVFPRIIPALQDGHYKTMHVIVH